MYLIWILTYKDSSACQYNTYYYYIYIYYIYIYIYIIYIQQIDSWKNLQFDFLYSYILIILLTPILFFCENLFFIFFFIDFIILLILFNFLTNYYNLITYETQFLKINKNYLNILLYNIILNFFSSFFFFYSSNLLLNYTNSVELSLYKFFFTYMQQNNFDLVYANYWNLQLIVLLLLFSFFIKLGVGPFVLIKFTIYKYLNLNIIFLYSSIYVFIIYLFFLNKFFFFFIIMNQNILWIFILIIISFFCIFFAKTNQVNSIKYFLAISSFITLLIITLMFFILILHF